jgi:c(7)-type cytochrome triheme protein
MNRIILVFGGLLLAISVSVSAEGPTGTKKRRPLPDEFGRVVIPGMLEKDGKTPVAFDHWRHRMKYTCRLCHVDLGFAVEAGGTRIREEDNKRGYYCGACHKGKPLGNGADFQKAVEGLPRGRFGNGIDWELAEIQGKFKLVDTLPGVSVVRKPLQIPSDYKIEGSVASVPEIIFSHKKHDAWNGCESCHPDVFGVKNGTTKYTMQQVFDGKYCGLCHGTVAFPAIDCARCHTKPVSTK